MLLQRLTERALARIDRTNVSRQRRLAGENTNLTATNPARHHLYAPDTAEARRIASVEWAKRHPFDHKAERRSRRHR